MNILYNRTVDEAFNFFLQERTQPEAEDPGGKGGLNYERKTIDLSG